MDITTSGPNQVAVIRKALDVEVEADALFDLFQITYNIFDQSLAQISTQLSAQNKKIIDKEALANRKVFLITKYPQHASAHKKLKELAAKYKTGIDVIALRFCIERIDPFKVLCGASNKLHLSDNLQATQFEFEEKKT